MAISKQIEADNGVVLSYHRIVSVNTITNVQNVIEVASYTSESKRKAEADAIANGEPMNVYIETRFLNADYDQTMTVERAYEWLKGQPEFADAADC